jgi:hypothetical protein
MRRGNSPSILENDKGEIYALNIGADFCAEHERGMKELRGLMGLKEEDKSGLKSYTASKANTSCLLSFTGKGNLYIIFDSGVSWGNPDEMKKHYSEGGGELWLSNGGKSYKADEFAGSWDGGGFGIAISKNAPEKLREFGKKLVEAIRTGDFAVWFGGNDKGNPFARAGLVVAVASMVPKEIDDYMKDCHDEERRLKKASDKTGIIEYLKKKGKTYHACSPKFSSDNTTVQYWLNPTGQDRNNFGWYSADELKDWADGKVGNKIDKVDNPVKV